ncbi:MAG: hypothetical protein MSA48_06280, partial [Bacteroides sp.]|nr:hypothetical protein [Bacteroides sp.]
REKIACFYPKQLHDNRINRRHYENPIVSPIIEISDSCQTALFFSALHKVMGDHASRGSTPARASAATWIFPMSIPTA